jgi:hypothetical protein
MVFKIAGWVLSFEQVRTWLKKPGQKYEHSQDEFLAIDLNHWFKERDIDNYQWATCTDYPRGSEHAVIMLVRRRYYNTIMSGRRADRDLKKQVLEESGLSDKDLPWVTNRTRFFQA